MSLGSFFVLLTLLSGTLSCSKTPRRPKGDYLLVVGGLKEYNRLDINDAEVVSLYSDDYSVPSCMYYVADFPVPIYETASGIINGEPVVCGGHRESMATGSRRDLGPVCYAYKKATNTWEDTGGRLADGSDIRGFTRDPTLGFVISTKYTLSDADAGDDPGWRGNSFTDLVVTSKDGKTFEKAAVLPELFRTACLASVADGLVFVKGYNKKSFLLKLEDGTATPLSEEGASERSGIMCAVVYNGVKGKEVVVAGGYGMDEELQTNKYLDKVEIFNLKTMQWRNGAHRLPLRMATSAVVPFDDSFILVGGSMALGSKNESIFKYEVETEGWTRLPGTLTLPSGEMAAMMVEESHFNC